MIASGINRVDEKKIRALLGEKIERASPEFVKEMTGFEVGGVPPLAHAQPCVVFLDEDLKAYPTLWAAGGTPNAVFEIGFDDAGQAVGRGCGGCEEVTSMSSVTPAKAGAQLSAPAKEAGSRPSPG